MGFTLLSPLAGLLAVYGLFVLPGSELVFLTLSVAVCLACQWLAVVLALYSLAT